MNSTYMYPEYTCSAIQTYMIRHCVYQALNKYHRLVVQVPTPIALQVATLFAQENSPKLQIAGQQQARLYPQIVVGLDLESSMRYL
jgi:hypothetical protein